jgi:hypothetical protein
MFSYPAKNHLSCSILNQRLKYMNRSSLFSAFGFLLIPILLWVLPGCQEEGTTENKQEVSPQTTHQEMISLLDSIAQHAPPMQCYHLNEQRAAVWRQRMESTTDPNQRFTAAFQYGYELINAGQLEDGIVTLQTLLQNLGGQLTEQTKILFEILAIAYLRLGEQQNCVDNQVATACIIPLQPEAYHQMRTGSEQAIQLYESILEQFPDDRQTQWLYNLAHMTLGQYPASVDPRYLLPEAVFKAKGQGELPSFVNKAIELGIAETGLSGGTCMDDFNRDGLLDIFATSYGLDHQVKLFLQQSDGSFRDGTRAANLEGIVSGLNTLHADYDNDGFLDILILRGGWLQAGGSHPNSLLRNQGDGTFMDVTHSAGLLSFHPTQTAAWSDFNLDGHLDLFIGNETTSEAGNHPSELYLNNGDGTFREVATVMGVDVAAFVKGCSWGDIDNDGWPDLYVSVLGAKNKLFRNLEGKGFEEIGEQAGVDQPILSFPCWFWDQNNDGFMDLQVISYDVRAIDRVGGTLVTEYLNQTQDLGYSRSYLNNGDGTFRDVTEVSGLQKVMFGMGCNFGDLDNDGWLDMYIGTGAPDFRSVVPNRMFRQRSDGQFEEVTMSGFGHIQKGHGIAFGDLDNDGDQDIYAVMGGAFQGDIAQNVLFENQGNDNQWINVQLIGKEGSNKSAIGARLEIQLIDQDGSSRSIFRTVGTGGSFGASSLQQEIGLGTPQKLVSLSVSWPTKENKTQVFKDLKPNTLIKIVEGETQVSQ